MLRGRKPFNAFVAGPTGVGKTACVKYVLRELQDSFDRAKLLYLNCFEYNSRTAVLSAIANFVGAALPRRGLATDEIFSKMAEYLRKCGYTPVVVLDEVDQLLLSEANSKTLYDLVRIVEHEKLSMGIVMISNDTALTSRLDARIKSSMAEQTVMFDPYGPAQLKGIISERAELAFVKGALDNEVVNVAAAHAARLGGDCRVALESLLKAGRIAERANRPKVQLADLASAFEDVDAVSLLKGLKHLDKDELGLLQIICQNQPVQSGRVYELYSRGSGDGLKERRLRDILSVLEKQGLVEGRPISLGNRGKSREYHVRAPRQLLEKEIEKQLSAKK